MCESALIYCPTSFSAYFYYYNIFLNFRVQSLSASQLCTVRLTIYLFIYFNNNFHRAHLSCALCETMRNKTPFYNCSLCTKFRTLNILTESHLNFCQLNASCELCELIIEFLPSCSSDLARFAFPMRYANYITERILNFLLLSASGALCEPHYSKKYLFLNA